MSDEYKQIVNYQSSPYDSFYKNIGFKQKNCNVLILFLEVQYLQFNYFTK